MPQQNYSNHTHYYPAHHFIFYPLLLILAIVSSWLAISDEALRIVWIFITIILLMIGWLAFMLRQHYALGNQNRIVRLELRFRYYCLTGKRFEPFEEKLSSAQLFALRFAADEELPALAERTLSEHLSPDTIKRSIKSWQPDYMRV